MTAKKQTGSRKQQVSDSMLQDALSLVTIRPSRHEIVSEALQGLHTDLREVRKLTLDA